jgi:hypothetical protein
MLCSIFAVSVTVGAAGGVGGVSASLLGEETAPLLDTIGL